MRHSSQPRHPRRALLRTVLGLLLGAAYLAAAAPAHAAEGSIDFVDDKGRTIQVIYSLSDLAPGAQPDLGSLRATFNGEDVDATAELASVSADKVRRTAVLAFDVSLSMRRDGKFREAKRAAEAFLDNVPGDVAVGIVTFNGAVQDVQSPTTDRALLREVIGALRLSAGTKLYDGVRQAVAAAGTEGSRSVLVLSDGKDAGSAASIEDATRTVTGAGVVVDVVALAQAERETALLQRLAEAGNGHVLSAGDPAALREVFRAQAEDLARQVLVRFTPPEDLAGTEGTLAISVDVDGVPTTDEAFVKVAEAVEAPGGGAGPAPVPPAEADFTVPTGVMYAGLATAALGVALLIVFAAGGGPAAGKDDALRANIEAYTRQGALKRAQQEAQNQSMTQQAVAAAESVLESNSGIDAALHQRLEAAGLQLKAAEWLLVHAGIALGSGLVGLLIGGGSIVFMLLALVLGAVAPWLYLSFKKSRRLKAFRAQLADTLQLMAGSLSAGLSLAQSVDTVVREGTDPIAGEFRRALIESRLGVTVEETLMGIAERMQSKDFEWVVMAIRIQREVGGNLAELLNTVAETIREREYLERQVLTLSAEGRLSVWILGGLPPGFMAYLLMANPTYLTPLYTSPLGWAMLIVMGILLAVGIFWMKRLVKVTV